MTAICASCDFVCAETRKLSAFKWRCLKNPVPLETPQELLFVDPRYLVNPPYRVCYAINKDGNCPDFQPRRGTHDD